MSKSDVEWVRARYPEAQIIAREAEETFYQIKALNKRLTASRSSAEKESIRSLIAAAEADWYRRVQPLLDDRRAEMERAHAAARLAAEKHFLER